MSDPAPRPRRPLLDLSRRTWLLAAAAFVMGLLLFAVMLARRGDDGFFRVAPVAKPADTAAEFDPLPAPLPGDEGVADDQDIQPPQPVERPYIVEQAPPAPPPPPPRAIASQAPEGAGMPGAQLARGDSPEPIPGQNPSPRYPLAALRRRESGTVRVRADVGPDGVPTSTSLVEGSGSRDLDRAALDAVRRWRFRPAQIDGRPTVGSVVVPINFEANR
ncbi:MAG: energy transducer TonB [Luteimonas sp.]